MNTSVERIDAHTVRLTVKVTADEVDAAIDDAYRRIGQKVKAPGFRAGKAPKPIIDAQVGRDAVLAEAQEGLVSETYGDALNVEALRPIEQPEIGELDLIEPGTEYEYVAEVQVRPELTLSSVEDLSVEVPPSTASEREIDAQINHLREKFATVEPVEDRGVAEKDFVLLSFVGRIDGEEYEGNSVDRYLFEMGRNLMPADFEEGLLGVKPGDELTIEFAVPDTSSVPEYIGKTASFEVTVHEVKEKVLPELTDELASSIGGFASVDEMRANTREELDRTKLFANRRAHEGNARAALAARLEGDVPDAMIASVRGGMMRDLMNNLESQGMSIERYSEATGMSAADIQAQVDVESAKAVAEELALEALFRQLGLEVTDEDIEGEIRLMAGDAEDLDVEAKSAAWEAAGLMPVIHEQVMHRKAVEWLMDENNVTVTVKDTEEEGEE